MSSCLRQVLRPGPLVPLLFGKGGALNFNPTQPKNGCLLLFLMEIRLAVGTKSNGCFFSPAQRLLGLSMEDPTPPLDTPEVFGGLKTRLFEGAKLIESERLGMDTIIKLDHGWPESRTSQARSAQRCRMRSFSLHFVKQARDSTMQGALRKLVGASWSAQVALRKLHCASCSAQVAPRKLLRQVGPCKLLCANCAPCKLLCASCSVQVALCKLLCVSCSRKLL